jgi:hypothetical protein
LNPADERTCFTQVLVFSFFHVLRTLYGAECAERGLLVVAFRLSVRMLLMIGPISALRWFWQWGGA